GCRMPDAGCQMQDAGCKMQDAGYRNEIPITLIFLKPIGVAMRNVGILFLLLPFFGVAQQSVYFTFFAGAANYEGDLRNKRFAWDQSQAVFALGLKYDIVPQVAVRTDFSLTKLV